MRVVPLVLGAAAAVLLRGMYIDTLGNPWSAHYSPWLAHIIHWRRSQAIVNAEAAALDAKMTPLQKARESTAKFAAQTHDAHDQVVPRDH